MLDCSCTSLVLSREASLAVARETVHFWIYDPLDLGGFCLNEAMSRCVRERKHIKEAILAVWTQYKIVW
jgi:hypothetical protein